MNSKGLKKKRGLLWNLMDASGPPNQSPPNSCPHPACASCFNRMKFHPFIPNQSPSYSSIRLHESYIAMNKCLRTTTVESPGLVYIQVYQALRMN